jgi:hypothetical protein
LYAAVGPRCFDGLDICESIHDAHCARRVLSVTPLLKLLPGLLLGPLLGPLFGLLLSLLFLGRFSSFIECGAQPFLAAACALSAKRYKPRATPLLRHNPALHCRHTTLRAGSHTLGKARAAQYGR